MPERRLSEIPHDGWHGRARARGPAERLVAARLPRREEQG